MALARTPSMGFATISPATWGPVIAVMQANGPYLQEYKDAGGDTTPGVTATLRNGVQGHFTPEGLFQIDYTPPEFSQPVMSDYAKKNPTAPVWTPTPSTISFAPSGSAPRPPATSYGPAYTPPASTPALSTSAAAGGGVLAARGPLGLPVLVWVGVGGLALFLIARRV